MTLVGFSFKLKQAIRNIIPISVSSVTGNISLTIHL